MQLLNRVAHLLRRRRNPRQSESDLDEEVRAFFETQVERRVARGQSQEEARRAVKLEFDDSHRVKEKVRDAWMGNAIAITFHDIRYALRVLRKNPGFAVVAVLSLALGLGANTAIFSLIDTVMLKSLPVKAPDRLFFVDDTGGKSFGRNSPPYPCFEILRDHNQYFTGISAFDADAFRTTIDGRQEQIIGQYASGSFFDVVGVGTVIGRLLTPADDAEIGHGGPDGPVTVISYRLWTRRFGRSPAVLGKKIQVGTNWFTIVGVTRKGFEGLQVGQPVELTIPMMFATNSLRSKQSWWFSTVGRLKDGASKEQATAELDRYFQTYMEQTKVSPRTREHFNRIVLVSAARGIEEVRRQFSDALLIVMATAGLVLLIGCANAANLLLARAGARRDEIALRLAIGASRGRVIRQLLTEGLLLVAAAAALSLAFARWGVGLLVALFATGRARIILEPHFDARLLTFAAAIALVTGILFSVAPALHAARTDAAKPGSGGRTGISTSSFRAGNVLVVIQVMLSLVLLCGAALFMRSLHNLNGLNAGFEREGILTMRVDATLPRFPDLKDKAAGEALAKIGRMWESMLDPLAGLPRVKAASVSSLSPFSGRDRGILMEVVGELPPPEKDRGIHINQVTEGYFHTFGLTTLSGRAFTAADRGSTSKIAILNESAVKQFFHDGRALGRQAMFPGQRSTGPYNIVGVVRDAQYEDLRKAPEPMVYVPIEQAIDPLRGVNLAIRTAADSAALMPAIRQSMERTVPEGFITDVSTVDQQVDETLVGDRLLSILASLFAGLALILSAIGLYGIMSYTVIRRTRELGIRIAVGAQRGAVLWLVLRATLILAATGLGLGLPLVWFSSRYIETQLYGVKAGDPASLAAPMLTLLSVALASAFWPAWRASRVDPMISLRQE